MIKGGQTGANQAILCVAHACGVRSGGWAPLGWVTEDGPALWLADYSLISCEGPGYLART